ncbi:hypothetical protein HYT23_02520 [Candidatus Pacearchaeota archaeon]|nr:hypothetical protein [Candidatus Pacearchaeota archaeon]
MGVIDYGDRMCVVRNGLREEIQPTSYAIDGKKMYEFNQDSGVLKLNKDMLPEGTLEKMSRAIRENPSGVSVTIPMMLHSPARLQRVREVEYLSESEVNVGTEECSGTNKPKLGFIKRLFRRT